MFLQQQKCLINRYTSTYIFVYCPLEGTKYGNGQESFFGVRKNISRDVKISALKLEYLESRVKFLRISLSMYTVVSKGGTYTKM